MKALKELIYQLADDDFILAYRGSEWLGLAPHIEEDVAFSSINQDMMGHATMYFQLLEALGEQEADQNAHLRAPEAFRNAVLLEEVNGTGSYLHQPNYDWAFTVVRNYFYSVHKKIRLDSLRLSSYEPLRNVAKKILMEQQYHLMHWEVWFRQLLTSTDEAKRRMTEAMVKVWASFGGVLTLGPYYGEMVKANFIDDENVLKTRWMSAIKKVLNETNTNMLPGEPGMTSGNGRKGEHTTDLQQAIATLAEVYVTNPAVSW
nr:1,2-phenylacetyl-CoA epoxidase subunit PaaC [Fictibacillus macauensis]